MSAFWQNGSRKTYAVKLNDVERMQTLMQDESESSTITSPPRKRKQPDMSKEDVLQNILHEKIQETMFQMRY